MYKIAKSQLKTISGGQLLLQMERNCNITFCDFFDTNPRDIASYTVITISDLRLYNKIIKTISVETDKSNSCAGTLFTEKLQNGYKEGMSFFDLYNSACHNGTIRVIS